MKGELSVVPFETIKQSDILTAEDFKVLEPLTQELQHTFLKAQVFRTRTEMEISVLNDIRFPTAASKYWQAIREQNVMFNELANLSFEYRKNLVEIKRLTRDLAVETDEFKKELIQIEIEQRNFRARNEERVAKDRIREIKAWSEIKEREAQNMTSSELEDVDMHQLISYTRSWIKQSLSIGERGNTDERNNLIGQLQSGLRACKKLDVLEKVLEGFSDQVREYVLKFI